MYKNHWAQFIPIVGLYFLFNMNKGEDIAHAITDQEMTASLFQGVCLAFIICSPLMFPSLFN